MRMLALACSAVAAAAESTVVRLVKTTHVVAGEEYATYGLRGSGPQWREFEGGIEGLYVKRGEMLDVTYHNELADSPSTIHAHGQKGLPPAMDGVPDISGPPIPPNGTLRINYLPSTGTYFLHSHWGLQHELGMAAPLIVEDAPPSDYPLAAAVAGARDVVVWLEDFCPRNHELGVDDPSCFDGQAMYDALKRDWQEGAASWNYSECMEPGVDSDVQYEKMLVNDATFSRDSASETPKVLKADAGDVLRLRVINAAGFNPYLLRFPFNVTVVATDGNWAQPYVGDSLWIALAQRLDILVEVPAGAGVWDVTATAQGLKLQGGMRFAPSAVLAAQRRRPDPPLPTSAPTAAGFMDFWDSVTLSAWAPLAPRVADKHVAINITGDNGFASFNQVSWQLRPMAATYSPQGNKNRIDVRLGQRVCVSMTNFNADAHPIHLHGHFFQVVEVNGRQVSGPMRDTFDMARGACNRATVCFDADAKHCEKGCEWPFHCHISYHLAAGMLTTVAYPPQ